jgi:signal peptidase
MALAVADDRYARRTSRWPGRGRWAQIAAVALLAAVVVPGIRGAALSALGYRVYVVESGSMEPALGVGDAILVRDLKGSHGGSVDVGDIITFAVDGGTFGTVTHRVVSVVDSPVGQRYVTKGDANRAADSSPVAPDRIVGEVVARFPWIGSASRFLSGLPFLLAIGAGYGATLLAAGARGARVRKVPKGRHQPPQEGSRT